MGGRVMLVAVLLTAASFPVAAQDRPVFETAEQIVEYVDNLMRGESSTGNIAMEIVTENWSRTLEMKVWSLGKEYSLVRVESPPAEAGTATLMSDKQVWNYLPRADRTIKIPPSLMMGSWMGSHFTNDDLVKESQLVEDYQIDISFEGERDGVAVWEFVLTPQPEAPVVWGRIEQQVRQDDFMPTWARYYDDDGNISRTMTFSDYTVMDGRLIPALMMIVPADKPRERTEVRYRNLRFNVGLEPDFFSLRNLKRAR